MKAYGVIKVLEFTDRDGWIIESVPLPEALQHVRTGAQLDKVLAWTRKTTRSMERKHKLRFNTDDVEKHPCTYRTIYRPEEMA